MNKAERLLLKNGEILRAKAEDVLMKGTSQRDVPRSEADLLKLVHELEVHKLELEMQYDELLIAKNELNNRANDKYAKLYNLAPVGFFTLSMLGEILELNQCGAQMLGKKQSNLINSRFGFFVNEKTKPVFNRFIEELFATHCRLSCELILNCPENIPLFVQLTGIEAVKEGQCLITMTDISANKIALAKLQESQNFLRSAQRIVQLGTFSIDLVQRSWESSEVFDHISGIPSGFDKSLGGWSSLVHPEWLQKMRDYFELQVKGNHSIFEMEYKIIRLFDQQERWVHVTGQFEYNASNQPLNLFGALSDITDRKLLEETLVASERKYRDIFHKNSAVKLLVDPVSGAVLTANQAASEFYGYPVSRLEKMNICELNTLPEDQIRAKMSLAVRESRTYFNFRHRLASGEIRDVEVYSGPVEFNGKVLLYSIIHDITERKKVEEELARSESFLNNIIDHSPNSLWISDEKGTLIRMNQACRKVLQIEDYEVVGKYNILKDSVIESEGFMPLVKDVFELGKTVDFVLSYNTASVKGLSLQHATLLVLNVHISPIFDQRGVLTNAIIQHIDITKQIQAEQNIRESEEKYRSVFSTEKDALFLIDKETFEIIDVNESACLLYGYSKSELLKMYNFNLSAEAENTMHLTTNFKARIGLRYHIKKDGTVFPTDISSSQFTLNGRRIVLAAIRDISEQQQTEKALSDSEERYRTVVESSSNSIVVHRDGKIIFVNPEAVKMFGANSKQDLIGCSIFDRIHPDILPIVIARIQKGNEDGESAPIIEGKYFRLDGSEFLAEVQGTPIVFDGLPAIQASISDITERKFIEEEIRSKNEELQRVNAEKDKFFSIIAHDLKSPFNGFLGLTEMMTKELSEMTMKEVQEISLTLNKSANNLYSLISNLLEWSRMQRGMITYNPILLVLRPNILKCLISSIDIAQKKGITIEFDIPENLGVYADVDMLEIVLRNLVNNAIKFTSKGGNIVVSAKPASAEIVEILISDSGIGMDSILIDNLFRLDTNTGRKGTDGESTTGLGLIICKDFIEKNGGRLLVESEVGVGSTFRFTIPAVSE